MTNCLSIALLAHFFLGAVLTIEVSSKIDFDSDDVPSSDPSSDKPEPVVIVVGNSNADTRKESRGFRSSSSRPRPGGNVSVRGPVKPIRSPSNYPLNPQAARPKVIKNTYIIVNCKGTASPSSFDCREGVCETTLSTDSDEQGNVVGSVTLTIVTKTEDSKVDDVPVVDGVRGTGHDDLSPTFLFDSGRAPPPFIDNNIPQTPAYRPNQAPRRIPSRPPSASFHPRNFGPRKESPAWRPWVASRGSVDDKLGAPLSRTNPDDQ